MAIICVDRCGWEFNLIKYARDNKAATAKIVTVISV